MAAQVAAPAQVADAAWVQTVSQALVNLNERVVSQHANLQSMGVRLQTHEGLHDPYLAKIDGVASQLDALNITIGEVRMFA